MKFEIGQCQSDMLRHRDRKALFGFCQSPHLLIAEMQYA